MNLIYRRNYSLVLIWVYKIFAKIRKRKTRMYLSTAQVSKNLNTSTQFVRNLIKTKELRAEKIGATWVISSDELDKWVKRTDFVVEPEDHPRTSFLMPNKIALSFFTGAGGLDIGLARTGIKPVLVNDIDKNARKSIAANYPDYGLVGDMTKLTPQKIYDYAGIPEGTTIDYMFGGPPCQAFSTAGKRRGYKDARGDVFIQYLELIGQLKPRYAIIENVRGLLSIPAIFQDNKKIKGGVLLYALKRLRSFGYTVSFNLYNAANFGAPEKRERVVIIAKLGVDKVEYLTPTNSEKGDYDLPKWVTFGEAVNGLPKKQHYIEYPAKRKKYLKYIPEGGNWRSMPIDVQKEAMGKSWSLPGGKTGFFRRLSRDQPAPTLVTHPTMPATDLIHPIYDRPLSVEEYARVQGFPDDWHIEGPILEKYKQIGNAVPTALAEAIGKRILADDNQEKYPTIEGFPYSRYKNTDDVSWTEKTLKDQNITWDDIPEHL